jgi:hypothetical protein
MKATLTQLSVAFNFSKMLILFAVITLLGTICLFFGSSMAGLDVLVIAWILFCLAVYITRT